ncbi:MAG: hypothetical protein ACTHMD_07720 [Flavisolibacter sp.]
MYRAKYTIFLQLIWGGLLVSLGLLLAVKYFNYEFSSKWAGSLALVFLGAIIGWGGLLFFLNFIIIGCGFLIKTAKRERFAQTYISTKRFWFDAFDLAKLYHYFLPKTRTQLDCFSRKKFSFLEKLGFEYKLLNHISATEVHYSVHCYIHPKFNRQVVIAIDNDWNVYGFVINNAWEIENAFKSRKDFFFLQELDAVNYNTSEHFGEMKALILEEEVVQQIMAYKNVLNEHKDFLLSTSWHNNVDHFYVIDHSLLPMWITSFDFLIKDYNLELVFNPTIALPFEPEYYGTHLLYQQRLYGLFIYINEQEEFEGERKVTSRILISQGEDKKTIALEGSVILNASILVEELKTYLKNKLS